MVFNMFNTFAFGRILISMWRTPATRSLTVLTLVNIGAGGTFYHFVENWSWVDSFYFTIITLTTVGYGDFSPDTTAGKLFTMLYVLLGVGLIASFISEAAAARQRGLQTLSTDVSRMKD